VPRRERVDLPDSIHHVTAIACGDEQLYREPADRRRFLGHLGEVVQRYEWRCDAYCLMGTHFHLIVYTANPTLSAGMHRLCSVYAQWFNWKYDRRGHLFGNRFSSQHITNDAHLLEAHRYVALNPVRAGLCENPAQWWWGSYRALVGLERPADFLDASAVRALFSQRAFREFVLQGSDPAGVRPQPFGAG
jgi:REP element-mobilizing transposase RayT